MANLQDLHETKWEHVYFKTWIGHNYHMKNFKIMMLGESHYLGVNDSSDPSDEKHKDCTLHVINEMLSDTPPPFSRCFNSAKAIVNGDYYSSNVDFWHNVMFYNFYQTIIGIGPRDKSFFNENGLKKSQKALDEVLAKYAPNLVIVWGKGSIRSWLPKKDKGIDESLNLWQYKGAYFWNIKHPSYAYKEAQRSYKKVKCLVCKSLK